MRRFFRDAGILLVFCGAFYLLTVLVNRLEADSGPSDSDFSPARKRANKLLFRKDWLAAKREFKTLTEQDPYNGYAWDGYASCIWEIRRTTIHEWNALDQDNPQGAGQYDELIQKIDELDEQSREVLLRLKKFSRYRYISLLRLAVLECDRGDYEEAMDYLEEFVARGYQTQRGLQWIENFGSGGPPRLAKFADINFNSDMSGLMIPFGEDSRLHLEPRFWDIVRREREIPVNF